MSEKYYSLKELLEMVEKPNRSAVIKMYDMSLIKLRALVPNINIG